MNVAPVIISKPENYNNSSAHPEFPIITINNGNPEYGFIMLRQNTLSLSDNGFRQQEKRVARYIGRVEELVEDVKAFRLKEGDDFCTKVSPVRLVIEESNQPFYDGQDCKRYPENSEFAGEPVLSNGEQVYRQTILVPYNSEKTDSKKLTDSRVAQTTPAQMQAQTEFDSK